MFLFNDSLTTQIDLLANAKYRIGQYAFDVATGRGYRYYYNAGADSTIVGDAAAHYGTTYGYITVTSGGGVINPVSTGAYTAGIAQAVIPTTYCGWFQTTGPGRVAAVTDGNVAIGSPLVLDGAGTPIGILNPMADGEEENVCGFALVADTSTVLAANEYILTID